MVAASTPTTITLLLVPVRKSSSIPDDLHARRKVLDPWEQTDYGFMHKVFHEAGRIGENELVGGLSNLMEILERRCGFSYRLIEHGRTFDFQTNRSASCW